MVYVGGDMMKRVRSVIFLIIVCFTFCITNVFASTKTYVRNESNYLIPSDVRVTESNRERILNTPAINSNEKVYDFAELLSSTEEDNLYKQIKSFVDGTELDFAVVTIKENNKGSAQTYAHDFYDFNYFAGNGLLFLIDMDTRTIYMVTKGSAVDLFPNSRMEPILGNVYKKVSDGKYYDACSTFLTSISAFVDIGEVQADEDVVVNEDGTISKDLHIGEVLIFALVGTVVVILIMIGMNRMVNKATSSREFLNKDTMKILNISEMFLGSHTSKTAIQKNSSSGGVSSGSGRRSGGAGHKF